MVDAKITELVELTDPVAADVLAIVDDPSGTPVTKKVTLANVRDNIAVSELADGTQNNIISWDGTGAPVATTVSAIYTPATQVQEVYTGSGFNSSATSGGTWNDVGHELTAIPAATVAKYNYAKITMNVNIDLLSTGQVSSWTQARIKAQIKETGGSYADMAGWKYWQNQDGLTDTDNTKAGGTLVYYTELTAGMKSNGIQIQAWSGSWATKVSASVSNIQTIVELLV